MYRTNEKVVRHNNNNNHRHDFSRSKPASKNNYRILYSNSLRRYGHPTTICRKDNNRTNFTSSLNNNKKRENNIATRNLSCKNRNNGQVLRNEIRACWNNRRSDNRTYDNNAKKMSANKSLRIRNVNGAALKGRFFKKAGDFVGSDDVDGPPGYGPLPVKQKTSSGARISKR
uniref:Uncharacterized protein n=1 Tax=Romanomermis culicivorax TaxID=13658 RepID=A0A915I296_ROMCU